ncbi:MAG: glycosyltransferase family protein, partial [Pseudoclavibacter sp.]
MGVRDLRTALWHLRAGGMSQVREWRRRSALGVNSQGAYGSFGDPETLHERLRPVAPTPRRPVYGDVRAAVILDEFSMRAWGGDFDTIPITPTTWRARLERDPVDLLLVESAWNGNDGAWQYQLTGSQAPSPALAELVQYCRDRRIPTVFWNKEDPPHFDDFLDTAALFDAVFTTDARLVPTYRERLSHDRVDAMSFAAAPAVHNPVRDPATHQRGGIAFGGMYFAHKYPERREQLQLLLTAADTAATKQGETFDIYSRFAGGDKRYQFPSPFDEHVVGSLPYDRMVSAYGAYKVFLNVNSVTESPSMCARRVFEISAAGTPVVTTRSEAIPRFFPQHEVAVVDDEDEAERVLRALLRSSQLRDRTVHLAQRRIWREHTYAHRASQVLEAIGDERAGRVAAARRVTVIVSTNRPHRVEHVLETVAAQRDVEVQLVLLAHGVEIDPDAVVARARELGIADAAVLTGDEGDSLGACLNRLVEAADGDVIAKFDDDDLYGPNYLADALNALDYSGADLVGK